MYIKSKKLESEHAGEGLQSIILWAVGFRPVEAEWPRLARLDDTQAFRGPGASVTQHHFWGLVLGELRCVLSAGPHPGAH